MTCRRSTSTAESALPSPLVLSFLAAATSVWLAGGCAPLDDITAGECGNSVTELGEDCDGEANCRLPEEENACRYRCSLDGGGNLGCPPGYGCDLTDDPDDGVCRRPSGVFVSKTSLIPEPTFYFSTGDLDGDRRTDVARVGGSSTSLLYHDDEFNLSEGAVIPRELGFHAPIVANLTADAFTDDCTVGDPFVLAPDGNPTTAKDLDDDLVFGIARPEKLGESADFTLIDGALAVYKSSGDQRSFESVVYPSLALPETDDPADGLFDDGFRATRLRLTANVTKGSDDALAIYNSVFAGIADGKPIFAAGGAPLLPQGLNALNTVGFVGADVSSIHPCDEVVLAGKKDSGSTPVLVLDPCNTMNALSMVDLPPNTELARITLDLVEGDTPDGEIDADTINLYSSLHVLDVNGDGHLDIVAVLEPLPDGPVRYGLAFGLGDGQFHDQVEDPPPTEPNNRMRLITPAHVSGGGEDNPCKEAIPFWLGDLDGDGDFDVVSSRGVLIQLTELQQSPNELMFGGGCNRRWRNAVVGQFNDNDMLDVAAARASDLGSSVIEFFDGDGKGSFTSSLISTSDPVLHMAAGDYDGDLIDDIAFSQALTGTGSSQLDDRISVSFGRPSGTPEAPRAYGKTPIVGQLMSGRFVGSDSASDIIVSSGFFTSGAQGELGVAIMGGSGSREIVAPYTLRRTASDPAQIIVGSVAGRIYANRRTGMVFLTVEGDGGAATARLMRACVSGEANISYDAETQVEDPALTPCMSGECELVMVDAHGDGSEEVVILSRAGVSVCRMDQGSDHAIACTAPGGFSYDVAYPDDTCAAFITPAVVEDLDGDGLDDVVFGVTRDCSKDGEDDGPPPDGDVFVLWNVEEDGPVFGTAWDQLSFPGEEITAVAIVDAVFDGEDAPTSSRNELMIATFKDLFEDGETGASDIKAELHYIDADFRNVGDKPPKTTIKLPGGEFDEILSLATGDFDGDGVEDVAVGMDTGYRILKGAPENE